MSKTLKVHFINDEVRKLYEKNSGVQTKDSIGFDCITIEDYVLKKGEFKLLNLGIVAKPSEGKFIMLVPRSSTFKKYKIIQTNSVGIIDPDYCGCDDIIKMPVLAMEDITIPKGVRIAQLVLMDYTSIDTEEFEPEKESRGGFGSTGR